MPPNSTNNFFGVKVSKAGLPVQNASDKQLVYKDDFSTKTYFDQTNSRMIEGLLPDGSYGLWVSKPGFDVVTATDQQLVFNSNQNIFKISQSGVASGTTTDGAQNLAITIPHGLGRIPGIIAYAQFPPAANFLPFDVLPPYSSGYVGLPNTLFSFYGGAIGQPLFTVSYEVNATNLILRAYQYATGLASSTNSVNFNYFILQETITQ